MDASEVRRFRIIVALTATEREHLHRLAERNFREPRLEAARLLRDAIARESATVSSARQR